jgi:hypothetical protein
MSSRGLASVLVLWSVVGLQAQPKKVDPKELPRVLVARPVGVAPGKTSKITLRGLKLDTATRARFQEPKTSGRLLGKGKKIGSPNPKELPLIGDSEIEIEVTVPSDADGALLPFTVQNGSGESPPHRLVVDRWTTVVEKEPNDRLTQAQQVTPPCAVEGRIAHAQDVDVFRLEGEAGQRIVLEVFAARCGGPLDPMLTLLDGAGRIVASNDDFGDSADSRIEVVLPRTGPYFVSVMDAHDQGGPAHGYRLVLREGEKSMKK